MSPLRLIDNFYHLLVRGLAEADAKRYKLAHDESYFPSAFTSFLCG